MNSKVEDIQKTLLEMQSLCLQVEKDVEDLHRFNQELPNLLSRHQRLADFYQKDWLSHSEAIQSRPDLEKPLYECVPEGHYSILAQDTIWDALQEGHKERLTLLKKLAASI